MTVPKMPKTQKSVDKLKLIEEEEEAIPDTPCETETSNCETRCRRILNVVLHMVWYGMVIVIFSFLAYGFMKYMRINELPSTDIKQMYEPSLVDMLEILKRTTTEAYAEVNVKEINDIDHFNYKRWRRTAQEENTELTENSVDNDHDSLETLEKDIISITVEKDFDIGVQGNVLKHEKATIKGKVNYNSHGFNFHIFIGIVTGGVLLTFIAILLLIRVIYDFLKSQRETEDQVRFLQNTETIFSVD